MSDDGEPKPPTKAWVICTADGRPYAVALSKEDALAALGRMLTSDLWSGCAFSLCERYIATAEER